MLSDTHIFVTTHVFHVVSDVILATIASFWGGG
jgi:hypothetical protein